MAITSLDIKLMASERMHDEDDGGGRMSENEIIDGQSNNMFPDVSELDRTYGRINLRKTFGAIMSEDTDTYYGGHLIVAEPPTDNAVHVTLFQSTNNNEGWTDERQDAQDKIESYVTLGPLSPYRLVGDCWEGQRAILVYYTLEAKDPAVGEILVLRERVSEIIEFVKITRVSTNEVVYTNESDGRTFIRIEASLDISDPILNSFPGGEIREEASYTPPSQVHRANTIPSVAYYGIQPLALPVNTGDRTVKVEDYKAHLLPATQSEEPLTDIMAGTIAPYTVSAGTRDVVMSPIVNTSGISINDETMIRFSFTGMALNPKPQPKTFMVAYRAQDKWYFIVDELGTGQLTGEGAGNINYTTGSWSITLDDYPDLGSRIIIGWGSFQEVEQQSDVSLELPKYIHTLSSVPLKPGTLTIAWTAGGEAKTAVDVAGVISGDAVGFVLYANGHLEFRPSSLPDMGTSFNLTYDKLEVVTEQFTAIPKSGADGHFHADLAQQPIPETVRITMGMELYSTASITVMDGSRNIASYWIANPSGNARYQHHITYPGGSWTYYTYSSSYYVPQYQNLLDLGGAKIEHGEARVEEDAGRKIWIAPYYIDAICQEDGRFAFGKVEVAAKTIEIFPTYRKTYRYRHAIYTKKASVCGCHWERTYEWRNATSEQRVYNDNIDFEVTYTPAGGLETNITEQIEVQKTKIDLTDNIGKVIVPNSVAFTMGGHTFFDWEGEMYRDPDANWVGTVCGRINYDAGLVELDWWTGGLPDISMRSMLVILRPYVSNAMDSYTTLAPLRPQSFQIAATTVNGALITGSANADGDIVGDFIHGSIDITNGTFSVLFGDRLLAADLSPEEKAEDWYDDDFVDEDGYVIKPEMVFPQTIRYNCVAYVYLPLSEDVLGLSPVRLPFDGKVPIYHVGDIVVVHHTALAVIDTPVNGQVVDAGRVRLSWVKIYDGNDARVDTSLYTPDLDAGLVTLDNVDGLALPLKVYDRIEDMALINELRIDGTLTVTKTLTHDYPLGSFASSALILKDMFGHISNVFEQANWSGDWQDELVGNPPAGRYNDTLYPITVTNSGATQERWALYFTSSSAFRILGEFSGQIGLGTVNTNCAPTNPATGEPYFSLQAVGWGAGWAAGNVLRFNSIAANKPVWIARTILQSEEEAGSDKFCIEVRGSVNTD